jgi:ubiquinone/menaquinone biosynthesis C-methylase UbiE
VLELGPGYCDFINQVSARKKVAVDINAKSRQSADPQVEFIEGDCCDLSMLDDGSMDLAFASNLIEHLDREQASQMLGSIHSVLRPNGRLILLQPNFRYAYTTYFDDYTHITPYTDKGLAGLLESQGYRIVKNIPKFLPLSMNSGSLIPRWGWIVRLYLNLPFRPLARQMLIVAEKPSGHRE